MNRIKDFFYDKNDIIVAFLILAAAAFVIYLRIGDIMSYPDTLLEPTSVEQTAQTTNSAPAASQSTAAETTAAPSSAAATTQATSAPTSASPSSAAQ